MEILAAVVHERPGRFVLTRCELEPPRAGEVCIRVHAAGVCHTDLTARDTPLGPRLPAVLGHEGAGVVVEVGPGVTEFGIGDRVLASFGACGGCPSCAAGAPGYCKSAVLLNAFGTRLDGSSPIRLGGAPIAGHYFAQSSFATHAVVSTVNLVKVPHGLDLAVAAPFACGVQTGMGAVLEVLRATPDDTLLVLGCGTVGLSAVMAGVRAGCRRIVAVDRLGARLELAAKLGATHTLDASSGPLPDLLGRVPAPSAAVDTTAAAPVVEAGFRALRPRGRLVCAGLSTPGTKLSIDANELLVSGKTLRGTIEGDAEPRRFLPPLLRAARDGELPVEALITRFPFEAIEDAAAAMRAGTVVKPVLTMVDPSESA